MTSVRPRIAPPRQSVGPRYGTRIDLVAKELARATVRLDRVDAVVTELVRLKCARTHDCRLCQSLRLQAAVQAGLDEAAVAQVDHYSHSDLGEAGKLALQLAEAMLASPVTIDPQLRAGLRAHFSDAELTELILDIVKWSQQKILVALRLDEPLGEGLRGIRYDADGNTHYEPVLP